MNNTVRLGLVLLGSLCFVLTVQAESHHIASSEVVLNVAVGEAKAYSGRIRVSPTVLLAGDSKRHTYLNVKNGKTPRFLINDDGSYHFRTVGRQFEVGGHSQELRVSYKALVRGKTWLVQEVPFMAKGRLLIEHTPKPIPLTTANLRTVLPEILSGISGAPSPSGQIVVGLCVDKYYYSEVGMVDLATGTVRFGGLKKGKLYKRPRWVEFVTENGTRCFLIVNQTDKEYFVGKDVIDLGDMIMSPVVQKTRPAFQELSKEEPKREGLAGILSAIVVAILGCVAFIYYRERVRKNGKK